MNITRDILTLEPEILFTIFGFRIANSTLAIGLLIIVFLCIGWYLTKKFRLVPNTFQVAIEMMYEMLENLIYNIAGNKKRADIIFPIIGAILVYLIFANLFDTVPGLTQITVGGKELFRGPTSDINTTLGLAFGAVIVINIISVKTNGIFGYLGQFFKFKELYQGFKKGISDGFVALIEFFVGLLDILGEITKVISLGLRLFGNMYAGAVLMTILFGAIAFVIPSVWLAMNLFVGVLQAMVFASLVAAYYMLAIGNDDEAETETATADEPSSSEAHSETA